MRLDVDNLRACVDELIGTDRLIERVRRLLFAEAVPGPTELGKGKSARKQPVAPTPWNDHAAGVLFVIHAGARAMEDDLAWLLFARRWHRSGSELHTRKALRNLPDYLALAADKYPQHWLVKEGPTQLEAWPRSCRALLDEARHGEAPWTGAPGGLTCPHCRRRLLLAPGWEREAEPPVWCRSCPVRLEDDPEDGRPVHREWPAGAWIATLNA